MLRSQFSRFLVLAVTGAILVASFAPMALAYGRHYNPQHIPPVQRAAPRPPAGRLHHCLTRMDIKRFVFLPTHTQEPR